MQRHSFKYKVMHKFKINEFTFFISFSIYLFMRIISLSFLGYFPGTRFIILTSILLVLIGDFAYVRNFKSNPNVILGIILVLFITFIAEYNGMSYFISSMPIFIYCARNIPFDKVIKLTLIITTICMLIIVVGSRIGLLTDYIYYNQGRTRHSLGFSYSLIPACFARNITFLKIYKDKEKIKWKSLVFLLIFNIYIFQYTNARLNFGLSIVILLIAIIFKINSNIVIKNKLVSIGMVTSFISCFLISVLLVVNYNPSKPGYFFLNNVLNNRLKYAYAGIATCGISFWGKEIEMVGSGLTLSGELRNISEYNYIDCSYIQMLINYGVLATLIILFLLTLTIYECYKDKDYYLMTILTLLALHMMIDDYVIQLGYNTFILLIGIKLLGKKEKIKKYARRKIKGVINNKEFYI